MAIELEVKLKDGVSVPAGSAAHRVSVLTAQMKALQTQMIKAEALGAGDTYQKAAEKYKAIGKRIEELGGPLKQLDSANKNAIKEEQRKIREMEKAQKAAIKEENDRIKAAQKAQREMEKAQKAAMREEQNRLKAMQKAQADSKKEIGGIVEAFTGLNAATLTSVGVAAMAAAAYGALALGLATVSQKAYEAAANHKLLLARLDALGGGAVKGEQLVRMMDELGKVLPQTRKEMTPWVEEMVRAGVRDVPRLTQAVKAAAAATAMVGESGGKAVTDFVASLDRAGKTGTGIGDVSSKLKAMGLDVNDVAKRAGVLSPTIRETEARLNALGESRVRVQQLGLIIQDMTIKKGIPSLKAMNATWDTITKKISEGVTRLFEDVQKTGGFQSFAVELQRVAQLFGLLDASGQVAKSGLSAAFDVIFKVAAATLQMMRHGFLELQIVFLKTLIFFAPVVKMFKGLASDGAIETLTLALKGMGIALGIVGFNLALLMAPFVAIGAVMAALTVGIGQFIYFLGYGIVEAAKELWKGLKNAWQSLKDFSEQFIAIGGFIVDAVVNGIKNGAGKLKDSILNLGGSAINWFKDKLEIRSPSRKFERAGFALPQGTARGVDKGTPEVTAATARMAMGATVGVTAAGAPSPRGGVSVTLASGAIQIMGGGSAEETVALVEESIVSMFERIALTQGVA